MWPTRWVESGVVGNPHWLIIRINEQGTSFWFLLSSHGRPAKSRIRLGREWSTSDTLSMTELGRWARGMTFLCGVDDGTRFSPAGSSVGSAQKEPRMSDEDRIAHVARSYYLFMMLSLL